MTITAAELAQQINAAVEGDAAVVITGPAKIEDAPPGTITFLADAAYEPYLYTTAAAAVLVSRDFQPKQPVQPTLLRVDDVRATVGRLLSVYSAGDAATTTRRTSDSAAVADSARLGEDVRIGKFTVVEEDVRVGAGTVIFDQVYLGPNVRIGANCVLYPGVRVLRDCVIGDNCVLQPNVVIGGDGFGFVPDPETNVYSKVAHVGNVVIEDDVEIGAGTTVDRAVMGSTIIRRGVKLDNLIQIAHNVEIGRNTVIAAMTGVAGSAKVGANCRIGGQVGIAGHRTVADGTSAAAQTGITANVKGPNAQLGGSPHMHFPDFMRSAVMFKNLPALIGKLQAEIKELKARQPIS